MIDVLTNQPLRGRQEGTAGPYIRLADSQAPEVQQLLERHGSTLKPIFPR